MRILKQFALACMLAALVACPPTPDNSVVIDNDSDFQVTFVSVSPSGTTADRVNLITEPIMPGFTRPFCCYQDGFYDIVVITTEPFDGSANMTEISWFNQEFVGPMSHVFNVTNIYENGEDEGKTGSLREFSVAPY